MMITPQIIEEKEQPYRSQNPTEFLKIWRNADAEDTKLLPPEARGLWVGLSSLVGNPKPRGRHSGLRGSRRYPHET